MPRGLEIFLDGEERGLGVERVEDGFEQQQVDAAFDQGAGLRRSRRRASWSKVTPRAAGFETSCETEAVREVGPMRAGDEAAAAGMRGGEAIDGAAGDLRAGEVQIGDAILRGRNRPWRWRWS